MATATPSERGVFTLSLDFELIWGTQDHGPERFRRACQSEHEVVIDRLLALLTEFEIPATWCIVGHLFLASCALKDGIKHPEIVRPSHSWVDGDWFAHDPCGDEDSNPIFYGATLIEKIRSCSVPQEIGCHSFSHVVFGDEGCSRATAASELAACVRLADQRGIALRSFAFPRNSVGHLDVLRSYGFTCYRGPEPVWWNRPSVPAPLKRLGHLVDVLAAREPPVVMPKEVLDGLWDIPGSMMYFPMHGRRRYIPVSLRVRRAIKGLERAVSEPGVFHLWFHPTNLADEPDRMFGGFRSILERVAELRTDERLSVCPMASLAERTLESRR